MKVFLAGTSSFEGLVKGIDIPFVLESFYYFKPWQKEWIKKCEMFLLDSGAFTFISNNNGVDVDWFAYLEDYARFINDNEVDYFFELDIDSIVGYDKVKEFREYLEKLTNKRCIPVWHRNRGKEEFLKLCEEYDYIGLGGIAIREFSIKEWKYFLWFIKEAHKRGCKLHGLGFTSNDGLKKYKFDTVDSTAWVSGCRFGSLYRFEDGNIRVIPKGKNWRGKREELMENNLREWIKFQMFAKENL